MTSPARTPTPASPYSPERQREIARNLGEIFDSEIARMRREGLPVPPELLGEDPSP